MKKVNEDNFYNLLSEFHFRPYEKKKITIEDFDEKVRELEETLKCLQNG